MREETAAIPAKKQIRPIAVGGRTIFRRHLGTVTGVALLAAIAAAGVAPAADADAAGPTADYAQLIGFVGGTPPNAAERQRLAVEVAAEQRSDAAGFARNEGKVHAFLASLPLAPAWERADRRVALRLETEFLPASEPARQIVDAHDPVVVFDRTHRLLVTEGTLAAWQRAYGWMAGVLSVPGPRADFAPRVRTDLKANFAALPDSERTAIAHVERNYPVMANMFERSDVGKRAEAVASARSEALPLDELHFGRRLAELMAQSYELAVKENMVNNGLLLNGGLGYNMLYRQGYQIKARYHPTP